MTSGTGITAGEAVAEVEVDMNVMDGVAGIKIIGPEAGAAVLVLTITENVGEADMMMRGAVEVDLMEVPLLFGEVPVHEGAHHHGGPLLRMQAQMLYGHQL